MPLECRPVALLRCVAAATVLGAAAVTEAATALLGLPLETAIEQLETEGLRIFYSTDLVKPWMRVEIEPAEADAAATLAAILAPHGLTIRPGVNDTWLVVRDPAATTEQGPADAEPSKGRNPSAAAEVQRPRLEEIVVSASRYPLTRPLGAGLELTGVDLERIPALGEDAMRPVARLPGAVSNGFSARPHLRGGDVGETLVRIDGLRLYDPFHLKDFQSVFSAVDPRTVSEMDVYTGGFPAAFGDRMSGVIDVHTLDSDAPLYHELGFSFFNTSLLSMGRSKEKRIDWLASVRRSNLDLLYDRFSEQPERPGYFDSLLKLGVQADDDIRLTANLLALRDDLELADDVDREERATARDRDSYVWLTLEQKLGPELSGRTLLSRAELNGERNGVTDKTGISHGWLEDSRSSTIVTVQTDWSWSLDDDSLLQFGGGATRSRGRYRYAEDVAFDLGFEVEGESAATGRTTELAADPRGSHYDLYAALRHRLNERLTAELGLRWDRDTLPDASDATLAPRLGLRFELAPGTELRASLGRYYQSQSINEMQLNDGIDRYFLPQRADHAVLGLQHRLPGGANLRVELYEKSMADLRPRFENVLNGKVLLPELKPDRLRIAAESASARGFELMFQSRRRDHVQWWTTYTWSRVTDRIAGADTVRGWDQQHALTVGVDLETSKWHVGIVSAERSGWPTSTLVFDDSGPLPRAIVARRNDVRLRNFRSLDLLATREVQLARGSLVFSAEIVNLFGRHNPCCIEYEIGEDDEAGQLLLKNTDSLPRIPSLGVLWKF